MTKRTADTRLTREQLEAGDYGEEADDAGQGSGAVASTSVLNARKIVKVKRHVQQTGEVQTVVPAKPAQFKLAGSLSGGNESAKPVFSFAAGSGQGNGATGGAKVDATIQAQGGNQTQSSAAGSGVKFAVASGGTFGGVALANKQLTAPSQAPKSASGTLFGGAKEPMFKTASGGTFGGVKLPEASVAKPEEKKPIGSMFGGAKPATTGGSLFGNLNTMKAQESDPAKKGSLFGGNPAPTGNDANQKFGLFFGAKKPDAPAATAATDAGAEKKTTSLFGGSSAPSTGPGLFGAPAGSTGLFGAKPSTTGSLFGAPPAGGLFGTANSGPTLFSFAQPQAAKKDNDGGEGEDDDDAEEEGEKSPPIYADTTKVEFKGAGALAIQPSPYTRLFEKHANTFKIVKPEDQARKITNCELSLEFAEANSKKVYLVVVRQAKKVLLQGTLNSKVSRCRRVEEKSAKNQLKIAVQQQVDVPAKIGEPKVNAKKIVFPYCVINFARQEEMIGFETEFNKALSEMKASEAAK